VNLRNALLELLVQFSAGPRVIMIQICIAIAALGLQLKSWTSVIPDVVAACGTSGDSLEALLQFLAVLPEEAYDGRRMILTVFRISGDVSFSRTQNSMIESPRS
jgi:transportin-3